MGEKSLDRSTEKAYLPPASPPRNHGHTTAAWVTTVIMLIGALVGAAAVVVTSTWLFWVGVGIVVVGAVVGRAMKMLGFGQPDLEQTRAASGTETTDERGAR